MEEIKHEVGITKVLQKVPNRFLLCVAVSRRARQLKEGMRPMVEVHGELLPVLTALEEISTGEVTVHHKDGSNTIEDVMQVQIEKEAAENEKTMKKEAKKKKEKDEKDKELSAKSKHKSKSLAA